MSVSFARFSRGNMRRGIFMGLGSLLLLSSLVSAHEDTPVDWSNPVVWLVITSILIIVMMCFIGLNRKFTSKHKKLIFWIVVAPVALSSLYLAGHTIYHNIFSVTKGPIHWHADFQIWNCGQQVDLIDPTGLSNKVGSPLLHEHNDNRIHVEGTVFKMSDISISRFFQLVGGELTPNSLEVPTNKGIVSVKNGDLCDGKEGEVQVFVYKVTNGYKAQKNGFVIQQEKVQNYPDYVLSPYSNVPPGDCIIVEFGAEKEKTEHICDTYQIALDEGRMSYG